MFNGVTTIEQVVSAINAALDAHSVNIHCDFVKSSGYFRFTHDNVGAANSVTLVVAPTGGGTTIATAALRAAVLDGPRSGMWVSRARYTSSIRCSHSNFSVRSKAISHLLNSLCKAAHSLPFFRRSPQVFATPQTFANTKNAHVRP